MSEPRCECCDLPVASCGKAAEQLARREAMLERQRLAQLPNAMPAQYAGTCGACGEWFKVGDIIGPPRPFGLNTWVGPCCLGNAPVQQRRQIHRTDT